MAPEPSAPSLAALAKTLWTPAVVATCLKRGLHKPLRSLLLFVLTWTTIGLFVSSAFFSSSFTAFLPFFLLGIFTGLVLSRFLMFKIQELSLAELRGADE